MSDLSRQGFPRSTERFIVCVTELGVMRSIPSVQGGYVIMREEIYGVVLT